MSANVASVFPEDRGNELPWLERFFKDSSIIILDDTTSSVDMETELKIQNTLRANFKDKTCFIIAHRLSSVKEADLILVMQDGMIIERGKHDELVNKKGYY
ncbi:MAG: hypothetical protein ACQEXB_08730 [Bacillota bacterium]